jgi:hypothetical protein
MNVSQRALRSTLIGALVIAILALGISTVVLAFAAQNVISGQTEGPLLPPCVTEDSDNCYWDADTRGNGQGNDIVVLKDGVAEVMP